MTTCEVAALYSDDFDEVCSNLEINIILNCSRTYSSIAVIKYSTAQYTTLQSSIGTHINRYRTLPYIPVCAVFPYSGSEWPLNSIP
jgi:hypothetical protein